MRLWLGLALAACALAQAPAPPQNQAETATKEEAATFKARVNLVMVPVVVRDKAGRVIGNLKQEDFQLFDRGKPQFISRFSIEKSGGAGTMGGKSAKPPKAEGEDAPLAMPERFVAYLFDDIHLAFADLARSRDAAWQHIGTSLRSVDRAAIYTTSGRTIAEFTDDKDKLHETLMQLFPHPINTRGTQDCPDVTYYMADMIQNKNDSSLLTALVQETIVCAGLDPTMANVAENMVRGAASRELAVGDQESRLTLGLLRDVVRRMGALPGQRSIVLVSPGFIFPQLEQEVTDVMDRAVRANVTISTLDARGLWVDSGYDATRATYDATATRIKAQYQHENDTANGDVLATFALGTGGNFFQNNNDLAEGFRKVAAVPEYIYLLGFSPQNLKLDGSFHGLKVTLKGAVGLTASARKGYYAPRHLADAEETATEEIREAIFSREELSELPISLHTQFFKPGNDIARLTVMAHVDLKQLRYRKEEGRNHSELTIVSALFDRNGNYVTASKKVLTMRLKDETLERLANTGISIRTTFDVKPGGYLIRLVVRDADEQMSAQNGSVEIP
jgi:VWFA-related protein